MGLLTGSRHGTEQRKGGGVFSAAFTYYGVPVPAEPLLMLV